MISKNNVLVTGGAGFIGSNIIDKLLEIGHKVVCLDNFSTGKFVNIKRFLENPDFKLIVGDIRDYETCHGATIGIDVVLHQAALGSVPRSIEYPLMYESNNINGTLNIFEASKRNGVKRVVYASSSSVYGDHAKLPKVESVIGNVLSPYALSKKTNEEFGKLYYQLYSLETIGLRYFNVFGPYQNPNGEYAAVIPKFIKSFISGEKITIYGDGEQSRDFTYVDNVVQANINAMHSNIESVGKIYNIACESRITLNEIVSRLTLYTGKTCEVKYSEQRKGDIKHSFASIQNAKICLKYNPLVDFDNGLKKTFDWFKNENRQSNK